MPHASQLTVAPKTELFEIGTVIHPTIQHHPVQQQTELAGANPCPEGFSSSY